jgi:hypothetical protein
VAKKKPVISSEKIYQAWWRRNVKRNRAEIARYERAIKKLRKQAESLPLVAVGLIHLEIRDHEEIIAILKEQIREAADYLREKEIKVPKSLD